MHAFTVLFLIFLLAGLLIRLWLSARQVAHVKAHRNAVPAAFADSINLEQHQKAADYTVAKAALGRWDLLLSTIILLAFTLGGGINLVEAGLPALFGDLSGYWQGIAVVLAVLLINTVLELPLSAWSTFVVEERFGFNRMTPGLFIADTVKALLLMVAIGAPLLYATLWFMQATGALWWLWVWALWMGFSLVLTWAYPTFIAPLFNSFSALEDGELKSRIEALLDRCGFKSSGIFVMDGSRRSAHGNAYFTGVGKSKRIVFFDTLIDDLDNDQIEAVLAHELGHFKRKHIVKRLLVSAVTTLLALALLGWLVDEPWLYSALGIATPSNHAALLVFLLVLPVFTFPLTPLSARYSRKHEFEADEFAAEQADPRALITALVTMYRENASTLTPDPLHSAFYDSHPPAPVRIEHLARLSS
ncbi:MAG: M48 family metallopeptidase [Gammaproteobacteria bacterium]|nr:M48 family metallopeptidase [Gammaproteobacteria bacterium]